MCRMAMSASVHADYRGRQEVRPADVAVRDRLDAKRCRNLPVDVEKNEVEGELLGTVLGTLPISTRDIAAATAVRSR